MTHTFLIKSLAAQIRDALTNLKLPAEYQSEAQRHFGRVNVYEQYLPEADFQDDTYYPLVVVEWIRTEDNLRGSKATVGLSVGVFAKESDGWKDAFHLMELIRQKILHCPILANRYTFNNDLVWTTADNQPTPFFYLYGELSYQLDIR